MRRFIAYISLLIAVMLGIGFSAKPILNSTNSLLDYSEGKVFTYQLTNRGENISDSDLEFAEEGAVEKIAEKMNQRLQNYGAGQYSIEVNGLDQIKVSVYENTSDKYNHISNYLKFDGRLTLATSDFEYVYANFKDDTTASTVDTKMFGVKAPYINFQGVYPAIVIPLEDTTEFKKAVDHAKSLDKKATEEGATEISEEAYLYLWSDWQDGDSFESAAENENIKNKLVMRFNYKNIWWEEKEENYTSICAYFNVTSEDTGDATSININDLKLSDIQSANEMAKYFCALLNADTLDYQVNLLYSTTISPIVDYVNNSGMIVTPALNSSLIGIIVAYVLLLGFALLYSRLEGLSLVINNVFGILMLFGIFNALGGVFSVPSLCAIILSMTILGMISYVYIRRLKNGIESGKTLKKALIDTNKSLTLLILDSSAMLLILGAIIYALGGSYISSMGIIFFIAGFMNILVNLILNRTALWFLCNSSITEKRPGLLGLGKKNETVIVENEEEHNVLDDLKEDQKKNEKPAVEKKTLSKKKIWASIYSLVILAGIITITVFGVTKTPYVESSLVPVTDKIVFRAEKESTRFKTSDEYATFINKVAVGSENAKNHVKIYTGEIETYEFSDTTNPSNTGDSYTKNYIVYVVNLDSKQDLYNGTIFYNGVEQTGSTIENVIDEQMAVLESTAFLSLKKASSYGLTSTFYIQNIALSCSIAIIAVCIYFGLRYKLSQSVATGLLATGNATIALVLYSMLRVSVNPYITIAAVVATVISLTIALIIMEENSCALKELKLKDYLVETKRNTLLKTIEESRYQAFIVTIIICFILISFLLVSKTVTTNLYIYSALMCIISCFSFVYFLVPMANWFINLFHYIGTNVKLPVSKKNKLKRAHKEHKKGREVEEATFIGIND